MVVRLGAGGNYLVAGVIAIALAAGGAFAVETMRAEGEVVADCSVSSARFEPEAFALAEACGKDIEIEALRTVYDTFWATPRQTIRADASSGAVRTDLSGDWEATDATVSLDESGLPQVAAPVYDMDLTGETSDGGPFMTMRADSLALSMGLPDGLGLGAPEIDATDASIVTYPVRVSGGEEIDGADLVLTIHPDATGYTPVLRIADAAAGEALIAAAGDEGLGFVVDVSGGLELTDQQPEIEGMAPDPVPADGTPDGAWEDPTGVGDDAAGVSEDSAPSAKSLAGSASEDGAEEGPVEGFYAVDPAGTLTFTGAPGWQWDSVAASAEAGSVSASRAAAVDGAASMDSAGVASVEVAQADGRAVALDTVIAEDGRSAVIRADEDMVTDPSGSYPVFVDPAVSGSRSAWTSLKAAWPTSTGGWKFPDSSGMGYCNVNLDLVCQRSGFQRLVWQFSGLSFVGGLSSADVVSATFRVHGTHSYNCTKTTMYLYRTPSINASTNWSNHAGTWDSSYHISNASDAYYSSACGGPHGTEWNATEVGKLMATNGWSGIHLGLRGEAASDMDTWKKLRYDARFSVEYNRAPASPFNYQTIIDGANIGCSTNASSPKTSRSLRPSLSVVGKDPDKQQVSVQFVVIKNSNNERVWESDWRPWQSPGTSGVRFTMRVPEGEELDSGGSYRWRAQIKDSGGRMVGYADTPACYFRIDISAPAEARITPLRDHPDAEAYYESGQERGGVGLTGCFEIYAPSTDSSKLVWGYATRTPQDDPITLDSTRTVIACPTPEGTGPKFLYVKIWDKAGLTSETEYEFDVATAREDGVWTFDDPEDPGQDTAVFDADRDEYLSAGQLSFSADRTFGPGPHQEFGARDGDSALRTRVGKIAWTDAPVVDTTTSFVVSAHVKLDPDTDRTGWYTALSQEGPLYNGFRLGYRPTSCPTTDGACWTFGVNREVRSNSTTFALSAVPVQFGQWVHLLGEYDKPAGKLRLYVCDAGTPDNPAVGEPILAEASMTANLPQTPGRFVVGRGFVGGAASNYWTGHVDNVRVFRGEVLAQAKIRRLCQGAEASSYVGGNGVDDVDPTWGDDSGENKAEQ